ncbi:TadE family type IV pilus minor pilin [Streptomyces sp. 6N223]|uniref:TadE family type IV pilus minor pilin n=1 Tax=Streptomyces sp. 6N223 TaxID=3457412 RepID=UPI003FCFAFC5
MVIPCIVVLLGMLLWGLGAVSVQLRCGDAVPAWARAVARGEPVAVAVEVARAAAPDGATVRVERDGDLYRVRVQAHTLGPGPLAVDVTREAVARAEPE